MLKSKKKCLTHQSQESEVIEELPTASSSLKGTIERLRLLKGEHLIAVGLSGGVDSSLTAALLLKAGWSVEGITLWLMSGKGSCCSDGLIDAAAICKQLDIPHHVMDARSTFEKEIINELLAGYQQGITPIPCSRCNRSVKFSTMLNWAQNTRKINRIATGHYARIRYIDEDSTRKLFRDINQERVQLLRGLDKKKDQSYFLYDLPQDVLSKVVFPLGELTKEDTRVEANRLNLRTAKKPESQDLCLAEHHGSMKAFLDNYILPRNGEIVLHDGRVIGEHDGIEHFTIGQRKGLGVAWEEPLHVIKIDGKKNQIIVAPRAMSSKSSCIVGEVNWVSINQPKKELEIEVQVRYRSSPVKALLSSIEPTPKDIAMGRPSRCHISFLDEQFSITPGQAAVFYSGEVLLGGGIIQPEG